MASTEENFSVEVRIPGSQKFTREQTDAIRELVADIDAGGYEARYPRVITASATLGTLAVVTLTLVGGKFAEKLGGKAAERAADKVLDIGTGWAKKMFKKHPRSEDEPPRRTRLVVLYGPDNRTILKEIEVVEDDDDDENA